MKKTQLSLLLAILMIFGIVNPSYAEELTKEATEQKTEARVALEKQTDGIFQDDEILDLVVALNTDYFSKYGKSYSAKELQDRSLFPLQQEFAKKANDEALSLIEKAGINFELWYKVDLIMVGFTGRATYADALKMSDLPFIDTVEVAVKYNLPETTDPLGIMQPMGKGMTNNQIIGQDKIYSKYDGAGTIVSILDSGYDVNHKAFYLTENGKANKKIKDEAALENLKAKKDIKYGKYYTEKFPFAYNYVKHNDDIKDLAEGTGMHGQHVAGTAAGNSVVLPTPAGDVEFIGVAPEAQILGMRVFHGGGTSALYYVPAMNDSVSLGADSINMSLGSPAGQLSDVQGAVSKAIDNAAEIGCVVAIAAGNESQFGYGVSNPDVNYPDYGIMGTPAVATYGMAVASLENEKMMQAVVQVYNGEEKVRDIPYVSSNSGAGAFDSANKYEFVDMGLAKDVAQLPDAQGKIALIERGGNLFTEKVANAKTKGAIGCIIYNSEQGGDDFVNMSLEGAEIPAISIKRSDGLWLLQNISTTLKVNDKKQLMDNPNWGTISEFSNWGMTADGDFKPDILAPGGHIYATLNDDEFGDMSGTSMATPHVAGGIALVRSRVDREFPNLSGEEKFQRVRNLLMSSAVPHTNPETGVYSSPRNQGAGIMNVNAAAHTKAVLYDASTKETKINLRSLSSDKFSVSFTAKNLSGEELNYRVRGVLTTDETKDGHFTLNPKKLNEVNGNDITISPNGEDTITMEFDASDYSDELMNAMPNGYFLEGFVLLESDTEPTISIPFVGFRGDFGALSVVEPFIYNLANEGRLPFYYDAALENKNNNFTHFSSMVDGKTIILGAKEPFDISNPQFGKIAVSPNQDNKADSFKVYATFLRNANAFGGYIYSVSNGEKIGEGEQIFNSYYGIKKNLYSGGNGGKWTKVETSPTWKFPGTKNYPDGEYYLELRSIPAVKDAKVQTEGVFFVVDTLAPKAVKAKFDIEKRLLNFTAEDTGSGIRKEEVFYKEGENTKYIEKTSEGYVIPEGIELSQINVMLTDEAYNVFNLDAQAVVDGASVGSLKFIKTVTPEGALAPEVNIKVFTDDEEHREVNPASIRTGKYVVEVENIPDDYTLLNEQPIKVEITEANLNQTLELKFNKIKTVTVSVIVDAKDYQGKYTVISIDKKTGKEYTHKQYQETGYFSNWFDAKVPYGDFKLEARNLDEGYITTFDSVEYTVDKDKDLTFHLSIEKDAGASIVVNTTPQNIEAKYKVWDDENSVQYDLGSKKFGKGTYYVYPAKEVEGYYLRNYEQKVEISEEQANNQEIIALNFNWIKQEGKGSVKVIDNAKDFNLNPQYIAQDYFGKVYDDLSSLSPNLYYILPKEGTYDKNFAPETSQVAVNVENGKEETADFKWRDIRGESEGTLWFNVEFGGLSEVNFEITKSDETVENYVLSSASFTGMFKDIIPGKTLIKVVNLPEGFYAEPETSEIQVLPGGYARVNVVIHKGEKPKTDVGTLNVKSVDDKGNLVPNVVYTVKNSKGEEITDKFTEIPYGNYTIEVKSFDEASYTLTDKEPKNFVISKEQKVADVIFNFVKKGLPQGYGEIFINFKDIDENEKEFNVTAIDESGKVFDGGKISQRQYRFLLPVAKIMQSYRFEAGSKTPGYTLRYTYQNKNVFAQSDQTLDFQVERAVSVKVNSVFEDGANIPVDYIVKSTYSNRYSGFETTDLDKIFTYGSYTIEPVKVPEGYIVSPEKQSLSKDYMTGNFKEVSFNYSKDKPIIETGSISVICKDDAGNEINDIEFTVKNSKGEVIEDIKNLPYGIYTVELTKYPADYTLDETIKEIEISKENPVQNVEFTLKKLVPLFVLNSVQELNTYYARFGTFEQDLSLPEKVFVYANDTQTDLGEMIAEVPVKWTLNEYDGMVPGNYTAQGELDLSGTEINNPQGLKVSLEICVQQPEELPKYVYFSIPTLWIKTGETFDLKEKVRFIPWKAESTLSFTSSDDSLLSVDENGILTALYPGKVYVTVETMNGKTAKIPVHITRVKGYFGDIEISNVEFSGRKYGIFTVSADALEDGIPFNGEGKITLESGAKKVVKTIRFKDGKGEVSFTGLDFGEWRIHFTGNIEINGTEFEFEHSF